MSVPIAVVGTGYVGLVASACFAELGHSVICVDIDDAKIDMLQRGELPIHEEYLPELLARQGNIEFTNDLNSAVRRSRVIFIAVGTPRSIGGSVDLSFVDVVAKDIARSIDSYKVIVEKSTVPVYTNEWIGRVIEQNGIPRDLFDVAANPEFLREGSAVVDFLHPDRIIIGVEAQKASAVLQEIYEPLTSGSYYQSVESVPGPRSAENPPPLLITATNGAEIIKYACNAFLAAKISFINAVANICEVAGVDVEDVARGIGMDSRIGPRFLRAGLGYGGSCFPKDVAAFRHVAQQLGINFCLLTEVQKINDEQKRLFFQKVRSALWTFRGKTVGVLGLSYKGGTDDIRESPSIELIGELLREGCFVKAYDPAALRRASEVIPPGPHMSYVEDSYSAAEDADALLILTDWQEFAELDLDKLHRLLRYPVIVDGRNLYNPAVMAKHGFTYLSVGRPPVSNSRNVAAWRHF